MDTSRVRDGGAYNLYIADKGVVFKEAHNRTHDLRIPWEEITECYIEKKGFNYMYVQIICDDSFYKLTLYNDNAYLGEKAVKYINEHKKGKIDDGWS